MDYQIINGKKFPPFPFFAFGRILGRVYEITGMVDSDRFSAKIGAEKGFLYCKDTIPVPITEITFDEQPSEKKYRPWTREDIGSLLFFKDKIIDYFGLQVRVFGYNPKSHSVSFDIMGDHISVEQLFNCQYSTDGINWLQCGVEIQ